jgi:hypothetical protein
MGETPERDLRRARVRHRRSASRPKDTPPSAAGGPFLERSDAFLPILCPHNRTGCPLGRSVESDWNGETELEIRNCSVIEFHVGRCTRPPIRVMSKLRREIDSQCRYSGGSGSSVVNGDRTGQTGRRYNQDASRSGCLVRPFSP